MELRRRALVLFSLVELAHCAPSGRARAERAAAIPPASPSPRSTSAAPEPVPAAPVRPEAPAAAVRPLSAVTTGYAVAFTRDGARMAFTTADESVELWDLTSGWSSRRTLMGPNDRGRHLAFDSTGTLLLVASLQGATLVDVRTGGTVASIPGYPMFEAALTADGTTLATCYDVHPIGYKGVHLWTPSGAHRIALPFQKPNLFASPVGSDIVVTEGVAGWRGPRGPRLRGPGFSIVDTVSGRVRWRRPYDPRRGAMTVIWSRDGRRIAWSFGEHVVHVADALTGAASGQVDLERGARVLELAWNPRTDALAIVANARVRYWDLASNVESWSYDAYEFAIPRFSSDGRLLVAEGGGFDRDRPPNTRPPYRLFDTESGRRCSFEDAFEWLTWRPATHELVGAIDGALYLVDADAFAASMADDPGSCGVRQPANAMPSRPSDQALR